MSEKVRKEFLESLIIMLAAFFGLSFGILWLWQGLMGVEFWKFAFGYSLMVMGIICFATIIVGRD